MSDGPADKADRLQFLGIRQHRRFHFVSTHPAKNPTTAGVQGNCYSMQIEIA